MVNWSRRRFVRAAGGIAMGSIALPTIRAQDARVAKLSDIDHIIILMKENRSFDHYFGMLAGVRGFGDPKALTLASGRSVFHQPDAERADGFLLPFRLDTTRSRAQRLRSLDHSWRGLHDAWNGGAMDNWLRSRRRLDGALAPLTMGYHSREDLPFYYALADAFTICDGYFASVLGPTHPNRFFLWSGSIDPDGYGGGPALDNRGRRYFWETYPERLENAGISWRIYHASDDYGCNQCKNFAKFQDAPTTSALYDQAVRDRSLDELARDIQSGNLPQVSWIVPTSEASEHPDYTPAAGEDYTRRVLEALWSNPAVWAKTVFILNYDENDGQFDHVPPPTPDPGTPGEFVGGVPVGLGFRVPCIVMSPFSRGGFVCGDTFDHTSTLRLIETRFGVEVPGLSRWRRETVGDLTTALGLGEMPDYSIPSLPDTAQRLRELEAQWSALSDPQAPGIQHMPVQEQGVRARRQSAAA